MGVNSGGSSVEQGDEIYADGQIISRADQVKGGTVRDRGTDTREELRASYASGDDGVDFQSEPAVTSYATGLRIIRSRELNLPATDPGD